MYRKRIHLDLGLHQRTQRENQWYYNKFFKILCTAFYELTNLQPRASCYLKVERSEVLMVVLPHISLPSLNPQLLLLLLFWGLCWRLWCCITATETFVTKKAMAVQQWSEVSSFLDGRQCEEWCWFVLQSESIVIIYQKFSLHYGAFSFVPVRTWPQAPCLFLLWCVDTSVWSVTINRTLKVPETCS